MRLNFSAVDEDDIREGVRRIGKVVAEQMSLYGTLTGSESRPAPAVEPEGESESETAQIVQMPTRRSGEGRARGT
jgi:2-aminoadipate transaminase